MDREDSFDISKYPVPKGADLEEQRMDDRNKTIAGITSVRNSMASRITSPPDRLTIADRIRTVKGSSAAMASSGVMKTRDAPRKSGIIDPTTTGVTASAAAANLVSVFATKLNENQPNNNIMDADFPDNTTTPSTHLDQGDDEDRKVISKQLNFTANKCFYPECPLMTRWDSIVMLCLMHTSIRAPYNACFNVTSQGFWEAADFFVDIAFGIDMIVNFNTAFYHKTNDVLVTNRKAIAKKYLRSWFIIDFVATVPLYLFIDLVDMNRIGKLVKLPKLLRVLKLLRLLKLLRVARVQGMMRKLEAVYGIHAGIARLIKLVFWIILVTHCLGCFWYLIPTVEFDDNPGPNSWLYRHQIVNDSIDDKYVSSIYWAFSTLTTSGYGDITGYTEAEKLFSLVVMAIGVTWYAFIVSSMSSIIAGFDTYNATMREKTTKLNSFMRDANLPKDLRGKLREHLEQASFDKANTYEAQSVMRDLPAVLRTDVLLFMHHALIRQIDFLQDKTPQFAVRVVTSLRPLFVETGESIMTEGMHAEEMYFLTAGMAQVIKYGKAVMILEPGCFFGEVGCLLSDIRHASATALTFCELYSLLKHDLLSIMGDYPQFSMELRNSAIKRLQLDHERSLKKKKQSSMENKNVRLQRHAILVSTGYLSNDGKTLAGLNAEVGEGDDDDTEDGLDLITESIEALERNFINTLCAYEDGIMKRIKAIKDSLGHQNTSIQDESIDFEKHGI